MHQLNAGTERAEERGAHDSFLRRDGNSVTGYENRLKAHIRRLMPRSIRPHRILAGPLRGRIIVTSWHDYPAAILGRTERALLGWFERNVRLGETWLDVGAHYGYTAIALSRLVGPEGRVFAFEPMLATFGCLASTRTLNGFSQLTVLPFGLGVPENLECKRLPVVRGMVDSTIRYDLRSTEMLLVVRLDWLWDRLCDRQRRIDGIKIDVQGMETEAIRGMSTLLQEFAPKLVVEVHSGVNRGELTGLIESLGYSPAATPIEPAAGETMPKYLDDRSYYFHVRA